MRVLRCRDARLLLLVVLSLLGVIPIRQRTHAQVAPKAGEPLIQSLKGPDLFRAYCASCHGASARGDGPMTSNLKTKVPDLTMVAKNNQGKFPASRVRHVIEGPVLSHGSRTMPIWGPIFHQVEDDQDFGEVRLQNLVKYLESIQRK